MPLWLPEMPRIQAHSGKAPALACNSQLAAANARMRILASDCITENFALDQNGQGLRAGSSIDLVWAGRPCPLLFCAYAQSFPLAHPWRHLPYPAATGERCAC
jgi:hypothetical protein